MQMDLIVYVIIEERKLNSMLFWNELSKLNNKGIIENMKRRSSFRFANALLNASN